MDLQDYLRTMRKRWRLIALCTLLAIAAAAAATITATPVYQAQAQLFVSASSRGEDLGTAYQGGSFTQQRVKSYADIVSTPLITRPVIAQLRLTLTPADLAKKISVTNPLDTVLLRVDVSDPSPTVARDITNAVATQFTEALRTLETPEGGTNALVKATVVKAADLPTAPVSPRRTRNLALGLLLGLIVGFGAAVLRDSLDTTVRNAEDLKREAGAPVLGVVPEDPQAHEHPLITETSMATSHRAEAYRQIRTNLQFVDVDTPLRSMVVTSAIPEEGKTTTACNLAIAIAESGARVILVEADLRRPRTADYLGLEGAVGVTNVLLGQVSVNDVLQPWGKLPLQVLASGPIPPNPSELLGSRHMGELIKLLTDTADFVILDAPPLLAVTDAAVLARQCDGALIVARHGHTKREQVAAAAEALAAVSVRLIGTVLNRMPHRASGYNNYGYGYHADASRPRLSMGSSGSHAAEATLESLLTSASTMTVLPRRSKLKRARED